MGFLWKVVKKRISTNLSNLSRNKIFFCELLKLIYFYITCLVVFEIVNFNFFFKARMKSGSDKSGNRDIVKLRKLVQYKEESWHRTMFTKAYKQTSKVLHMFQYVLWFKIEITTTALKKQMRRHGKIVEVKTVTPGYVLIIL